MGGGLRTRGCTQEASHLTPAPFQTRVYGRDRIKFMESLVVGDIAELKPGQVWGTGSWGGQQVSGGVRGSWGHSWRRTGSLPLLWSAVPCRAR